MLPPEHPAKLLRFFEQIAAALAFVALLALPSSVTAQVADSFLDVNDISFLWPVPTTKAEADSLISLADDASDGPIMPAALFKALIAQAETVSVDGVSILFPNDQFNDPKTWKVAGIRVNPSALGTNPLALARAEIPGIRVIVQPVLIDGDNALPQDYTAHVVFNYVQPIAPNQPIKPDREAFSSVVQDLRDLKNSLGLPNDPNTTLLQVHPGFFPDPQPLTEKLRSFLKKHLASKLLDRNQLAAISFMGIPGGFEPWIFFKVEVDTSTNSLTQKVVSGKFATPDPTSQFISFLSGSAGKIEPMPAMPGSVPEVSTAVLFPILSSSQLETPLFPAATDPVLAHFKFRDVADIVANPQFTNTTSTDCVSCHTESTRRHLTPNLTSQPGTAFTLPAGISGVSPTVLPKDRWNLRNFGWGLNIGDTSDAPRGFHPTISQRAANEAADSADYINKNYPPAAPVSHDGSTQ
jgi:hypothetical protein